MYSRSHIRQIQKILNFVKIRPIVSELQLEVGNSAILRTWILPE